MRDTPDRSLPPSARSSLAESFRTVAVPGLSRGSWRRCFAFFGPGYLIAVGYIDPGNWATDLAGGSAFGYLLLPVILVSGVAAMVLQILAVRLGVATGRDLAQACAEAWPGPARIFLWLGCELAICACDLAELIGAAIALKLLFHIPVLAGVFLTIGDVLLLFLLRRGGFRKFEAFVIALLALIGACLAFELAAARPSAAGVLLGLIPSPSIVTQPEALYLAVGIIGATVMPHNLYLHSAVVQTRRYELSARGRDEAARFAALDSGIALAFALIFNGAILVLAAATFHRWGHVHVAEIEDAYRLLTPVFGPLAAAAFGVALLAAGQSSTITATLAGQVVMEGFVALKVRPWVRRAITRAVAIAPAVAGLAVWGEAGLSKLLVGSQVLLSLQLPFAMIPLLIFTGDRRRMGALVSGRWLSVSAWSAALVIVVLDLLLLLHLARLV